MIKPKFSKSSGLMKRHYLYTLPIVLLLIVAVAGWFVTDYLGNNARQEIIRQSQASLLTVSVSMSSTLANIEGAVKALAGSPWIAPALVSKRGHDFENANSVLDRYNSAVNASVSYLMTADGMTVASSNRNAPDSFVGKSYHFRPYFQEAVKGRADRYFAMGITSGKRGFYASHPVRNPQGKVLGVVTMKKDLDEIEPSFSKYPFCVFISPEGIIFLSSSRETVLKSLWPLDKAVRDTLIASRQFGSELSETGLFRKEILDGAEVILEGKDYLVFRKVIDSDGWSIVLLTPTNIIRLSKLSGIMGTISVCFIIIILWSIIHYTDRSHEAIKQIEESRRLLLHAAGEGIFGVDARGQLNFANPAALRMLGFTEKELLGQKMHALIHHHHKDGSIYPEEDCPMYASYTGAVESHMIEEVLWRRDGSSFPAEYSSMPITMGGKTIGAVVTIRDITERKKAEEVLAERRKFAELSADVGSIWIQGKELHTALQSCAEAIVNHLDAAFARIWMLNQEENVLELKASAGMYTHLNGAHGRVPVGKFKIGLIAEELKPHLTNDVIGDPRVGDQEWARQEGMVSFAGYPLMIEGRLFGVMAMFSRHRLSEVTLDALRVIADRIAIGISRQQMEKALLDREKEFRNLLEEAPLAIIVINKADEIELINSKNFEIIGYTRDETPTLEEWWSLAYPDPEERKKVSTRWDMIRQRVLSGENIGKKEKKIACKDGTKKDMEISYSRAGEKIIAIFNDITERKKAEEERERLILELKTVIASVKTLSGMLPICAACKKIRDDRGYWKQVENYVSEHTEAVFTSGICPDCEKKMYEEIEKLKKEIM